MYLLSRSTSTENFLPSDQNRFRSTEFSCYSEIANLVSTSSWSTSLFAEGKRSKANFLSAQFAALDFDDGTPDLVNAAILCERSGLRYIIGTTKSHQVEKNGLLCDRYRIIFQLDKNVISLEDYEETLRWLSKLWPTCDKACLEGSRFFFPIKAIAWKEEGSLVKTQTCKKEPPKPAIKVQSTRRYPITRRAQSILERGFDSPGSRHRECYYLARSLGDAGLDHSATMAKVLSLPVCGDGFDENEICTTANAGWLKGKPENDVEGRNGPRS